MLGLISLKEIVKNGVDGIFEDYNEFIKKYPDIIADTHFDKKSFDFLKCSINKNCDRVLVEFPYYDWEYLSTVYTYYIKATKSTIKECYRLHFYVENNYMGYIVLRPTPYSHIGRIQMDPRMFLKSKAYIITNKYNSNIMGIEATVECFQFTTQDPEVAMCAQVAAWAILECTFRFGWDASRMKVAEITGMTWTFPERKIPAKGLTTKNIMEVLSSAGLFPILRSSLDSSVTKGEIFSYIESGIPVIGLMASTGHAICLIGHGRVNYPENANGLSEYYEIYNENLSSVIMNHKFISSFIVNDDNYAPYKELPMGISLTDDGNLAYNSSSIDSFIIPLSEKMYMTYDKIYSSVITYLESHKSEFPNVKIVRIYLTLSKSYKTQTIKNVENESISKLICSLNMPSFIWCAEISEYEHYKESLVDCQFIFDSTRHSEDDKPWLLIQSLERIRYYDGETYRQFSIKNISPYKQYRGNLEEYIP